MISNTVIGWGADLDVLVAEVPFNHALMRGVSIELDENQHDVAYIRVGGLPHKAVTEYRNAPVRIHYTTGGQQVHTFFGYIEEVRPRSVTTEGMISGSIIQEAVIVCFGVSYAMRGATTKSWGSRSLTSVAQELAYKYKLSLSCPNLPAVFDNLLQHGESDFAFLIRTAKEHGYCVSIHGTHIDVWDPYQALQRRKGLAYLRTLPGVKGQLNPSPGQILDFNGKFGRNSADGRYKNTEVTVMDKRGTTFEVSSADVFNTDAEFSNRHTTMLDSYAEAETTIEAAKRAEYDYTAKVQTLGVASAIPGTVVDVQGFNADYDGYWYVRGVKHTIATGVFTTEFDLGRNIISQFSPSVVDHFRTPPAPSYIGGKWQASRLKSYIYA